MLRSNPNTDRNIYTFMKNRVLVLPDDIHCNVFNLVLEKSVTTILKSEVYSMERSGA